MKVVVTGASGFVGGHVVAALVAAGHDVVGLSRTMPKGARRDPKAVYFDGVDVGSESTLKPAYFDGADAVVHLVGIIQERGGEQTFERIHVTGTGNVVDAASNSGSVKKFVYLSAIGSDLAAPSVYSQTKAKAESLVRAGSVPFTILRPSIILGADGEFVAQMKDLVLHGGLPIPLPFPFIPVPGSGNNKFQPIFVEDLCSCIVKAVEPNVATGEIIEVGGATQVTFNELLDAFAKNLGVKKPKLHAPIPILMAVAPLLGILPNPPVTVDQLKNLGRDNTCDNSAMKATFALDPMPFAAQMDIVLPPK
ncbi:MAG TPA: NAD-dependent epimerase/dehydratase family protein [Capsulimonadaceae bacterium]